MLHFSFYMARTYKWKVKRTSAWKPVLFYAHLWPGFSEYKNGNSNMIFTKLSLRLSTVSKNCYGLLSSPVHCPFSRSEYTGIWSFWIIGLSPADQILSALAWLCSVPHPGLPGTPLRMEISHLETFFPIPPIWTKSSQLTFPWMTDDRLDCVLVLFPSLSSGCCSPKSGIWYTLNEWVTLFSISTGKGLEKKSSSLDFIQ